MAKPTTTQQGLGHTWQKLRPRLLAGNPRCHWCGNRATTLDHLKPRALGGPRYDPRNLVPACARCNSRRGGELARQLQLERRGHTRPVPAGQPRMIRHGAIPET
jgi:5-methylcytosine-specific restriction endonuclease McrA